MHRPRINLLRLEEDLSDSHLRLAGTTIENLPWQEFIGRYDRPETFFYLDPPYYKAPYYTVNLGLDDYAEMAKILASIEGKFILSINDHPEIRDLFKSFKIKPVELKYTVSKTEQTIGKELLVSNY